MRRQPNEARTPPGTSRVRDLLLAAALALATFPAAALGLGELRVQSFIGEPLEATVALIASEEEEFAADCFSAVAVPGSGVPSLTGVRLTLERSATRAALKVRTLSPITEPTLRFRLLSSCSSGGGLSRDYLLALDPRPTVRQAVATVTPAAAGTPGQPATAPAAAPGPAPRASTTRAESSAPPLIPGFRPRPGDTLQSISAAIFPREEQARAAYLRALRARNPSVASLRDTEPLPTDMLLILPDLKALSRSLRAASPASRPAEPAGKGPRADAEPRKGAAPTKPAAPEQAAVAPATKAAPPPKAATAPEPRPSAAREAVAPGDGAFRLRLSATELDTSRSRGIDERKRAEIRERRLLLEQDDQTAAMLGLRENLRQLENRFAALQRQVTTPGKGVVAEAPKVAPATPAAPASPATAPIAPASAPATGPAATGGDAAPARVEGPLPTPAPQAARPATPPPAKPPSAEPAVDWPWLIVGLALALAAGVMTWWKRRSEGGSLAPAGGEAPASRSPAPRTKASAKALPAAGGSGAPRPTPRTDAQTEPRLDARRPESERPRQAPVRPAPRAPSPAHVEEAQDPAQLRQRYRQARFPEIANGVITLSDPVSVVRGARTLYEDGALARAIELLELAVADDPKPLGPWLALLEIHRQEGLAADFGALAARFQWQHGDAAEWPKVQSVGREFDPDNPLFAASGKVEAFNPLTDNWLDVPSDFSPHGLAAELHAAAVATALGRRAA